MKQKITILMLSFLCMIKVQGQSVNLLTPLEWATGVTGYPVFSWQLTSGTYTGLTYTFKIAEYNPSIGNAASLSSPVHTEVISDNNNFITYNYPVTLQPLDTCKEYVWQVTASYTTYTTEEPIVPNGTYNYISPFYHFYSTCVASEQTVSNEENISIIYVIPKKETDHFVYLITTDSLYLKYNEPYDNDNIKYKIYGTALDSVTSWITLPVQYGLNYLSIPITDGNILTSPKIYTLEIRTRKGESLKAKFEKQN